MMVPLKTFLFDDVPCAELCGLLDFVVVAFGTKGAVCFTEQSSPRTSENLHAGLRVSVTSRVVFFFDVKKSYRLITVRK